MSQFEAEWGLLGRELIGMNTGELIKNTPGKIRHIHIKAGVKASQGRAKLLCLRAMVCVILMALNLHLREKQTNKQNISFLVNETVG